MEDSSFKPKRPDQSKEDAAWALCTWLDQQGYLKSTSEGIKLTMNKSDIALSGPFKVVLPITGARRQIIEKAEGGEEAQLWLHVEASGPERDADGDRMSVAALSKMVGYATEKSISFLDGHYRDLLSAMLGTVMNPHLTDKRHFAFDVLLDGSNPFAAKLFNDILEGKKHGASIAGVVHAADVEEYGEDQFGRLFHDVELIEVSRTSWPSWRDSFITLVVDKMGKLPEEELAEIVKRQDQLAQLKSAGGSGMLVRTEDGGVETWAEDESGVVVVKIKSPHGWDKKFGVSNTPWSDVADRSKPCQYAIIKENVDGSFSISGSGYPHHMPNCDTVNRGGVIASAGRLVQALKSHVPAIETPPIVSLVAESIGEEEYALYKQESKFTNDELKFAARHIIRHYRQDLEMEPSVNLVEAAKTYSSESEEIVELIRGLVKVISSPADMEGEKMAEKEIVVAAPAEEQEVTEEQLTETVTEPVEEAEPAADVEQEAEPEKEVVSETDADTVTSSALAAIVDSRLIAAKFGELLYATKEMVMKALRGGDLQAALTVVDDFAQVSKTVLTDLSKMPLEPGLSFLEPIEKRIELETGQLTKGRVKRIEDGISRVMADFINLQEMLKKAAVVEDVIAAPATSEEPTERKSEHVLEFEQRLDAIEQSRKAELDKLAAVLEKPKREEVAPEEEGQELVQLSDEEYRDFAMSAFKQSLMTR